MSLAHLSFHVQALKSQIGAIQAQVLAIEEALAIAGVNAATDAAGCPHADVENLGTFGAPEMRCRRCGAEVPS